VICAALWPDPADPQCPPEFIKKAREAMLAWTPHERQSLLSEESQKRFEKARKNPAFFDAVGELRAALLDFIADFANWDNSTVRPYLDTSHALTQAAHEALGGVPGTRPLVVDPFAGGGSIPLEALRVGADTFASDLNPIPILLNKVVLEYIPKYGQRLADEVLKWGDWIKREAEKELAAFYPKDKAGATPIAYLWARTIQCEGPGCGAEVPLIRSLWLAKKAGRSVALQLVSRPRQKYIDLKIIVKQNGGWVNQDDPEDKIADPPFDGTIRGVAVTCPCCKFTTDKARVREQLVARAGGADTARLLCVVTVASGQAGRSYRLSNTLDLECVSSARQYARALAQKQEVYGLPDEPIPHERVWKNNPIRVHLYGMTQWKHAFTSRQALALATLGRLTRLLASESVAKDDPDFAEAVAASLALAVGRQADYTSSLCMWVPSGEFICHTFGRQAIPMVWDFVEVAPLADATGCFMGAVQWVAQVLGRESRSESAVGHVESASATHHPLPDDSAAAVITDPPYYDAVPYSTLSNYFYIWLKRAVPAKLHSLLEVVPVV
jgi:adenine-specific DNA methylase